MKSTKRKIEAEKLERGEYQPNPRQSLVQQMSEGMASYESQKARGMTWLVGKRGRQPIYEVNDYKEAVKLARSMGKDYVVWRPDYQPNPRQNSSGRFAAKKDSLPRYGSLTREQMLDDAVFRGVVEALHFTESDELGDAELSLEAMDRLFLETRLFVIRANPWLYGIPPEQIGHDFWLTRNHHGAGFWDRGLSNGRGKILTDIAHSFGELILYVGDDGQIHF